MAGGEEEFLAAQRRLAPRVASARPGHAVHRRVELVGGCVVIAVGASVVAGLAARGADSPAALPPATRITAQLAHALQASSTDVLYDQ